MPGADPIVPAAVLFDLDGVLVDSLESVRRHWRRWCDGRGIEFGPVWRAVHNQPSEATIRQFAPALDAPAEAARLDAEQAADSGDVTAQPGAADLLGALQVPWAVVTSCTPALARARLAAARLPAPALLVAAGDTERGKPHPDPYLLAAERAGAPPGRCLVVEDAPGGIRAGKAAGATVVAVGTTHGGADLAGADVVVGSLADVSALLHA
jgi:sugar-phosphatase